VVSADLLHLADDLDRLSAAGISRLHIDVMDGVFSPQMTVGPPLVAALPKRFELDVHLMIDEPLHKVDAYVDAGADLVTFHLEATRHPHRVLQHLGNSGVKRGVALNPGTPVVALEPLLDDLELVLILAVNPGWSGQKFIAATAGRVAATQQMIAGREVAVAIDGGVTRANARSVASLGADVIVAGSAVFAGDVTDNVQFMLAELHRGVATATPM
jgi:ribulose-phosphate 3-epimerase